MLNKRTKTIGKCMHRNKYALADYDSIHWNVRCKVEVSCDYWNFWSLRQSDLLLLWSRLTEVSPISINFKNKCILCDANSTLFYYYSNQHLSRGSNGGFPVTCVVTPFKIGNHYIVANLTIVVHSAEDYCASSMKRRVPKKVVLFIVLP